RSAVAVASILGSRMQAAESGRLVFLSSLAAYAPTPFRGVYSASKSALGVTAATLRAELAPSGVDVTLVVPGFVRTAISESALRADGAVHGIIDPNQASGMDPGECARRILHGIERGVGEFSVAMGFKGRLALLMGRLAPRLQKRLLARIPTSAESRS
ncbi:MAG: SDR family NAD(P)-dependent oxidoreductase, partial [Spirochaetota bacterium]